MTQCIQKNMNNIEMKLARIISQDEETLELASCVPSYIPKEELSIEDLL
jgi:hypothetical protein